MRPARYTPHSHFGGTSRGCVPTGGGVPTLLQYRRARHKAGGRPARPRHLVANAGRGWRFMKRRMDTTTSPNGVKPTIGGEPAEPQHPAKPPRLVLLIRHGET